MTPLFFIGGGGHSLSCLELVNSIGVYKVEGVYDEQYDCHLVQHGIEFLGKEKYLSDTEVHERSFMISIGQIKSPSARKLAFEFLNRANANLPNLISPFSWVSQGAKLGVGVSVFHRAVVNHSAYVGDNSIINTGAIIEHNSFICEHCHISTGAIVNGNVKIGSGTFIGSGVVIKNGVSIGENCIIQAGTTVLTDIPNGVVIKN